MLFPLWPPVAIIALLMMLTIMIILIYGDKICARVRTQTDRIAVRVPGRVPRPSLEPMMRMGSSERGRQPSPQRQFQQQQQHQHQQEPYHLEEHQQIERYSPPRQPQQYQPRYDEVPMEVQKQSTTYGHRECEV